MKHVAENRPASRVHPRATPGRESALQDLIAGQAAAYAVVGGFDPVDRIGIVKAGLPAQLLATLASDMQVPRERLYAWLGIARTTANRKVKDKDLLSQDESERALGITRLVGQVQTIVSESGNPEGFDAARWTAQWLDQPNDALGGRPPGEFMDTADGRALVSGLVAQMQSGAYA
ncbi:antitoxin Xre-like helix-turn-helix domain-containing protein [Piscinibacter sp.]|uniref:antitoxin Xre-like helix-turn-helix domain-containing protein n=1 Tax=Piscinibacter sp. TaxID=1903157 RepID=UPI0039E5DFA2